MILVSNEMSLVIETTQDATNLLTLKSANVTIVVSVLQQEVQPLLPKT